MGATLHLRATLEPRGPAGAFVFTDDQVAAMGGGAKVFPVVVVIGGKAHQLRLARMGSESLVGFSKAARAQAGIEIGDEVTFDISADTATRTVEVPADLAKALSVDSAVAQAFESLSYSHRKNFVKWVSEAKRDQTRIDRIAKTVDMVRAGQTR